MKDEREFIGTCWGTQSIFSALADCVPCAYVSALSMSICHLPTRCERFFSFDFWRNVLVKIFCGKSVPRVGRTGKKAENQNLILILIIAGLYSLSLDLTGPLRPQSAVGL